MYRPTLDEAKSLVGQGNLAPIHRELPADLETPVSVYLKLSNGRPSFLLESVEKGEQLGRYSFIGVDPPMTLTSKGSRATLSGAGDAPLESQNDADPLDVLADVLRQRKPVELSGLPRFTGGAVGYFGYDLVRFMERLPDTAVDDLPHVPDCMLLFADNLVIFDHVRHKLIVLANMRLEGDVMANYADAVARLDSIVARLREPLNLPPLSDVSTGAPWESNVTQEEYERRVEQAREYIAAGDIFQVVLSQRLRRRTQVEPFTIYRALRMTNPSPYMYFLNLPGQVRVIGSSPEMHVRLEGGLAYLHPIAGTRWRGETAEEDARLAEELLADPKERAEHVMLVDLGRNDLGRVCEYGSVQAPTMMAVERFSHVMHIVSDVVGKVRAGHDAFSLLRATFPAGTVSGAPKVRAMEIIEELEGVRRGLYAGAVGYIDYDGAMDTCIAIRTILMHEDTCYLQAGGGIVADSDPTYEFNESMNKAKALAVAVELAEKGLIA